MRTIKCLLVVLLVSLFFTASNIWAIPVTVSSSSDTFITKHAYYGGITSTHGSDLDLITIGAGYYLAFPLLQFDLSSFAGGVVNGSTANLQLHLNDAWNSVAGRSQSLSIRQILVSWDEATASFSNFGGSGFDQSTHTGADLITQIVTFSGSPEYISFDISSSVVQGWIDNNDTNFGLIVYSNTWDVTRDLEFSSRESDFAPLLTFDVDTQAVPEPSTMLLLGSGLFGLGAFRKKFKK